MIKIYKKTIDDKINIIDFYINILGISKMLIYFLSSLFLLKFCGKSIFFILTFRVAIYENYFLSSLFLLKFCGKSIFHINFSGIANY